MTDICQAVYSYLSNDNTIRGQVQGRIYPVLLPQDAPLPAIVYTPVLANYDSALQGDTGFTRQTIQIICHHTTFGQARKLARRVKALLQDYHGDMNGVDVQAVFIKSDYSYNSNSSLKFNTEEYMHSTEYEIHFNEK